jgi:glycosyltransferase involved in cell wall biosynthesis
VKVLHFLGRRYLPSEPAEEGTGGVFRVAMELALAQRRLGHEVSVAAIAPQAWWREWHGVRLVALREAWWAPIYSKKYLIDLRTHIPMLTFCRNQSFDVVHGHEYPYLRFVPATLRVAHVHNNPFWTEKIPEQWDYQIPEFRVLHLQSELRVAVSAYVAQQLERARALIGRFASRHQSNAPQIVRNGVEPERFSPVKWMAARSELRQMWGFRDEDVVFLYAGAITPDKGVIYLARAFAELWTWTSNARLVLAGGADLWRNGFGTVRARDQEYESGVCHVLGPAMHRRWVRSLGVVSPSAMPGIYAASDVVVVPSLQEAFGLVIAEALASGKPVIASSVGGIPELTSTENSILVPAGDTAALVEAMRILIEQPVLRLRLAHHAERSVHGLTWSRAAERLDAIYGRFLSS